MNGYTGSPLVLTAFHVVFISLVLLIFPRPRLYVYTFLAGFLFLGFWPKLVAYKLWSVEFLEPVGNFSGSAADWDSALLAATAGALGVILTRITFLILQRWKTSKETPIPEFAPPWWFIKWRRPIIAATIAGVVVVNVFNMRYAIFQVGVNPLVVLPLKLNVLIAWLINAVFAIWIAALLHWNFQIRGQSLRVNLLLPVTEGFLASLSSLSRLAFLLHVGPYFLALAEHWSRFRSDLGMKYLWRLAMGCAVLLCTGVLVVFLLRVLTFNDYEQYTGKRNGSAAETPAAMTFVEYFNEVLIMQVPHIFLHRWVGLEGVLTASSVKDPGAVILKQIITDDPKKGAQALYQNHARPGYLASEPGKFTFLTNAGPIALLLFSGSLLAVLSGMALVTILLVITESAANRFTGNPFLLAVIGAGMANVVSQSTFPYLSMIYMLQIWVAIMFLWLIAKIPEFTGKPIHPNTDT
ncbi:MAG: hypothetical protein ACK59Y_05055 [Betaproteobacteria bacterium]|jgi:hypothetical protein